MAKKKKIAVAMSKAAASKSSGLSEMEESRRRFAEAVSQEQQQASQSSTQGKAQSTQPNQQQQERQSKTKQRANLDDHIRFGTVGMESRSTSARGPPPTLSARNIQRFMYLYEQAVSMNEKNRTDPEELATTALFWDMAQPDPQIGSIMGHPMDEMDATPMESLPPELQLLKQGLDKTVTKKMIGTAPAGAIPSGGIGPMMMPGGSAAQLPRHSAL